MDGLSGAALPDAAEGITADRERSQFSHIKRILVPVSSMRRYGASGEADAFQPVEDRHGYGRSGPPGSECCVVVGDDNCEAYTAIRWGVGLSLEIDNVAEAEPVIIVEGNMCGTVMRGAVAPPGSKATSRRKGMRRNLRDLTLDQRLNSRLARVGKARSRSR